MVCRNPLQVILAHCDGPMLTSVLLAYERHADVINFSFWDRELDAVCHAISSCKQKAAMAFAMTPSSHNSLLLPPPIPVQPTFVPGTWKRIGSRGILGQKGVLRVEERASAAKAAVEMRLYGTAEAVPFQNVDSKT